MAQFDPAAATAAYLAALTPAEHAKAQAYTQGGHWLVLWGALIAVAVAWMVLRAGVLVRTRDRLAAKGAGPWLVVAAVVALDSIIEAALSLPWTVYAQWWREKSYALTSQPFTGWLSQWLLATALGVVLSTIVLSVVYWAIRRSPRWWWAWGGAVVSFFFVVILVIGPVFIQPLFNTYRPAPPGPTRDAVVALADATGVPADKIYIYDGSRQSNRYTANVSGLAGTVRISMSDVMFRKNADIAEVRGVVGHEIGHYKTGQVIWSTVAFGLLAAIGLFLTDRLYPRVRAWTRAKGVGELADPAGYPVLSIIITVLLLLATPIYNTITRFGESQADDYSLRHANEPDGLARALVKTIEYRAATPGRLEEIVFYDHPSVGSRVRKAMDWKAKHPAQATTSQ